MSRERGQGRCRDGARAISVSSESPRARESESQSEHGIGPASRERVVGGAWSAGWRGFAVWTLENMLALASVQSRSPEGAAASVRAASPASTRLTVNNMDMSHRSRGL